MISPLVNQEVFDEWSKRDCDFFLEILLKPGSSTSTTTLTPARLLAYFNSSLDFLKIFLIDKRTAKSAEVWLTDFRCVSVFFQRQHQQHMSSKFWTFLWIFLSLGRVQRGPSATWRPTNGWGRRRRVQKVNILGGKGKAEFFLRTTEFRKGPLPLSNADGRNKNQRFWLRKKFLKIFLKILKYSYSGLE